MADGLLGSLLSGRVSPNRALLKPFDLTPTPPPDLFNVPPPANPLDVPFGQAVAEGAAPHIQDVTGVQKSTAKTLGEVFSNAAQLHPAVALTSAAHDVATSDDPQTILSAAQTGLGAVNPVTRTEKLVSALDEAATPTPLPNPEPTLSQTMATATKPPIKASHASPHNFDQFRWDEGVKGTGEGAQVFGQGLYFGEHPDTLQNYYDQFLGLKDSASTRALAESGGDVDRAIAQMQTSIDTAIARHGADEVRRLSLNAVEEAALKGLNEIKQTGAVVKPTRYDVNIHADPEHLLHYDKLLHEQPPHVKQALGIPENLADTANMTPEEYSAALDALGVRPSRGMDIKDMTGGDYVAAETHLGGLPIEQHMKQQGVPGIKYLDEGSRFPAQKPLSPPDDHLGNTALDYLHDANDNVDEALASFNTDNRTHQYGYEDADIIREHIESQRQPNPPTHNYVVFDPKIIEIVKKYGIAGALGAGLITQEQAEAMQAQQGGGT